MRSLVVASVALMLLIACGGPPEKPARTAAEDGVPANSAAEALLSSSEPAGKREPGGKPASKPTSGDAAAAPPSGRGDPTAPYVQRVGEADPTTQKPEPAAGGPKKENKKGEKAEKGEKISKSECELVFDKLLTIEFNSNPDLASVPAELRAQVMQEAKAQARQQGNADCNATKAQYKCAMAASTKPQWMACMK